MNTFEKCVLGAATLCGGFLYLTAPGSYTEGTVSPFRNRYIAHRGLHTEDQTVPENSLAAFSAAADAGYAIELDVALSKDGKAVVMHDDDLERACGVSGNICDKTWEELSGLRLFGTEEKIPLLEDVLSLIDGRVPILVELKSQGSRNAELCQIVSDLLYAYGGPYCIESFDPRIVRWFRKRAPWIFRGQLACPYDRYDEDQPAAMRHMLANCMMNFMGRPQFISYKLPKKPLPVKAAEKLGAMRFCWTSHAAYDSLNNDAVIFEYYRPPLSF